MSLQIQLSSADPTVQEVDVLAICVTQGGLEKHKVVAALDAKLDGALLRHAEQAEFNGKADQTLDIPTLGRLPARRVLLIGAGEKRGMDDGRVRALSATAARAAGSNTRTLAYVPPEKVAGPTFRAVGEGLALGAYRFTKYFTGDRKPKAELGLAMVYKLAGRPGATDKKALATGQTVADAVCVARDAVNEPPNELTPAVLADIATRLARKHKFKISVLDKAGIKNAGMHLHYAVGQGSANEPRFIHMSYKPKKPAKRKIAFVGKGLTFDSGGLCIKPAPGMGEMKSDMGGAAAVLGTMVAVADLQPDVEVHCIIGSAENMPDGAAYRPGDVFGSLDGKTVEIINTDAEGRLVLADALAYAAKLEPDVIIDAATLTGACVIALGKTYSGFYTGEDKLARQVETAAKQAGEQLWRMPLVEEIREQLKSDIADLKHTGERWGGSISAALFLREFTAGKPWVHCDIAGPALSDRARGVTPKGGTGHPVLTFVRFVENSA